MKLLRLSLLILSISLALMLGCTRPPTFPLSPIIDDPVVEFIDAIDPNARDTLALSFHFTDGDGDMGLLPTETDPPYNLREYGLPDVAGDTLRIGDPAIADIPYAFPFTCLNWELNLLGLDQNENPIYDTLYYTINDNHYNITIDWYTKPNGASEWELFDWRLFREPACGETFDGRFPILFDEQDLEDGFVDPYPMEGRIRYNMTSSGFLLLFGADSMRLDVEVKDRALNRSNRMQAKFTLPSIRREE